MVTQSQVVPRQVEDAQYKLGKLVVAHDLSDSSQIALDDAMFLGKKYDAEVLIAHVQSMAEETARGDIQENQIDLQGVGVRFTANGVRNREILRGGLVGDSLFDICCSEDADLLMLGAYGYGPQDRSTLGSTAEYLLRAMPCPTLTYGPCVTASLASSNNKGAVLVPLFLPCEPAQLRQAVRIAKLFDTALHLLHVADVANIQVPSQTSGKSERQCENLASCLRDSGVPVQWSVVYGKPTEAIKAWSIDLRSHFILMPLRWRKRLSSIASDNVAAHVIRSSHLPVMTYRID